MNRLDAMLASILADAGESEKEILSRAREQAAQIDAEGRERAARILAEAEEAAGRESAQLLERARASCSALQRASLLRARSAAVDAAYDEALARLIGLGSEEKRAFLCALLASQIAKCLKDEADSREYIERGELEACDTWEVLLCAADRAAHGEALVAACTDAAKQGGKTLLLSEVTPGIPGGLILRTGNVEHNLSLIPLLGQVRAQTEAQVHAMLFDASAV